MKFFFSYILFCISYGFIHGKSRYFKNEIINSTKLQFHICSQHRNPVVRMPFINIDPMPVTIPGNGSLNLALQLIRKVPNIDVRVDMKKLNTYFGDIYIPCIGMKGSCVHNDVCNIYETYKDDLDFKPWNDLFLSSGLKMECPIEPFLLHIKDFEFEVPDLPPMIGYAASGTYEIKLNITDHLLGTELGCAIMRVHVAEKKVEQPCAWWDVFCDSTK